MDDPRAIESGDYLRIDHTDLSDVEFRVTDTDTQDMGVAEVFAAGMTVGCDRYSLTWLEGNRTLCVTHLDSDEEWDVEPERVEVA